MDKVVSTIVGIVAAVGLSALVFIGVNKLFDLTENRFPTFNAIVGGISTLIVFLLLWGNDLIVSGLVVTLIATAIGAATGFGLGMVEKRWPRLGVGLGGGLALGLLLGSSARSPVWPGIDPLAGVIGLAVGAALGGLLWLILARRRSPLPMLFLGLAVGWLLGGWMAAEFTGSKIEMLLVAAVLGLLVGAWVGSVPFPSKLQRARISLGSRKYIFLSPALLFIFATLVLPLARTIWLGFLTGSPTRLEFSGLANYARIFADPNILDFSDWPLILQSKLFWAGVLLALVGIAVAFWQGRTTGSGTGTGFEMNAGTTMLLAGAVVAVVFAVFVFIRGTIPNNLWWIFSVTFFSVAIGLAVAVIADRSAGENLAKSLIFLPLSISFVGASIIWRGPMYIARPSQDEQTGFMNAIWVQIGEWSNSTTASLAISLVLALAVLGLGFLAWRGWSAGSTSIAVGSMAMAIPLVYLIYLFLGPGVGGFVVNEATGQAIPDPILFLPNSPWNNWWMMVVFIWIQTGFAMVIFSAAIKAVPADLLEAARIDGATESQTFWRVTIPQIYPTIGVVATTLIVTVLKVFDIPKVMTNGNFDTQVLANEMWQRAFTELNFGLGSALAVLLFLGVLPVMYLNIRRMQKERMA